MIDGMSRPGPAKKPQLPVLLLALVRLVRSGVALIRSSLRGLAWVVARVAAWLTTEEEEPPAWATSGEWVHGMPGGLKALCLGLLIAVPLGMVGLRVYGRMLQDPAHGERLDVLTYLTRAIAAEAGGNGYCAMEAKIAVGAAMLHKIQEVQKIPRDDVRGYHVRRFLDRQAPNYLMGYRTNPLYDRNLDWLETNGFSECVAAARRALSGEDPSGGARHWYDDSIPAPYPADVMQVTKEFATRGNRLIFYRFRPGAKVRPASLPPSPAPPSPRPQVRPGPVASPRAPSPADGTSTAGSSTARR